MAKNHAFNDFPAARAAALLTLTACMALTGCGQSVWNWVPGIYRVDIQQGNAVTEEMVSQLQPGMTKRQVAYIMGTPLIQDPYHPERWDYTYTLEAGGEAREASHLSLYFSKDQLAGIEGDFRPSDEPVIATAPHSSIVVPRRELDTSWWGHIRRWFTPAQ